jgi:hypothetical protein
MRKMLFKTILVYDDGAELPITIAASEITEVEPLIQRNLVLYNKLGKRVVRFYVAETFMTLNLSDEKYNEELVYADIVED